MDLLNTPESTLLSFQQASQQNQLRYIQCKKTVLFYDFIVIWASALVGLCYLDILSLLVNIQRDDFIESSQLIQTSNRMITKSMTFLLLLAFLCRYSSPMEFQSYGEFTRQQLSQIIEVVQDVLGTDQKNKARVISDKLNAMMDQAWYVIYMDKANNFDNVMVLYGYAFKNHWMWLSNFVEGRSVVLWKDYNCDTWVERAEDSFPVTQLPLPSEFKFDPSALEYDGLNNLKLFSQVSPEYMGETWKLVFDITTAINNNQNAYAFSGFAVQIPADDDFAIPEFSYRVCKKAEKYETLHLFHVDIKDYREEIAQPAAKALVLLMRTR